AATDVRQMSVRQHASLRQRRPMHGCHRARTVARRFEGCRGERLAADTRGAARPERPRRARPGRPLAGRVDHGGQALLRRDGSLVLGAPRTRAMLPYVRAQVADAVVAHAEPAIHADLVRLLSRPGYALHPEGSCRAGVFSLEVYKA